MHLHPAVAERLSRLAPDQRAAATAPPGPVLCVAPAGSGKTTTLVARICWLVATGSDPARITAVTFNKRAADELQQRLLAALEPLDCGNDPPRVKTFHALGREILAEAGVDVANLIDRAEVVRRLNGRPVPAAAMRSFDDSFSRLKLDLSLGREDALRLLASERPPPVAADMLNAYVAYEEWLAANAALDFDDLVRRAVVELRTNSLARSMWQERCAALLVDEVQDVDRTQLELALLLAGERRNVFLVGDDDQTIYAWRLADVRRVLDLAARCPACAASTSSPTIAVRALWSSVRCASSVSTANASPRRSAPDRRPKGPCCWALMAGTSWRVPGACCTEWLPAAPEFTPSWRAPTPSWRPSPPLPSRRGIPYRAAEDGLLLDDPGLDEMLEGLPSNEPPAHQLSRRASRNVLARSLVAWSLGCQSVDALRSAIAAARERRAELRRDDAQLILATAHGTKGLEFDHVAVIGLDDGVFPSRRTLEEADDPVRALEEERRLAYVAWTRAKKSLLLVYDPAAPSVFMREAFSAAELG